jgi:hypothetical protein
MGARARLLVRRKSQTNGELFQSAAKLELEKTYMKQHTKRRTTTVDCGVSAFALPRFVFIALQILH